jgi:hypothetical protein
MVMAMLMVSEQVDFLMHLSENAHLSTSVISATVMVRMCSPSPCLIGNITSALHSQYSLDAATQLSSSPPPRIPCAINPALSTRSFPTTEPLACLTKTWRSQRGIVSVVSSTPHAKHDRHTHIRRQLTGSALRRRYMFVHRWHDLPRPPSR